MGKTRVLVKLFNLTKSYNSSSYSTANTKMVTSVLLMMMTIFSLNLVKMSEAIEVNGEHRCPVSVPRWCKDGQSCVYSQDGSIDCCAAGTRPWQLDDGSMVCCENGHICPRQPQNQTLH